MSNVRYQSGDLVHTGDYFVYEIVQDNGDNVVVTPAYGYPTQWGDKEDEHYGYRKDLLYPGDGTNK